MREQVRAEPARVSPLAQPIDKVVQTLTRLLGVIQDANLAPALLRHPHRHRIADTQVPCAERRPAGGVIRHPRDLQLVHIREQDSTGDSSLNIVQEFDLEVFLRHAAAQVLQLLRR